MKSNVWNPGQSRKLVVRLRATRPKASLTARLFRRSKKINPVCFGLVVRVLTPTSPAKASSKTMCSEVHTKMLTHPESSWKTDNNSIHWSSYCSLQEPAKKQLLKGVKTQPNSFRAVLVFLLEAFSPSSSDLQLASVGRSLPFSLCSQACLTVATATLTNTRPQR